MAKNLFHVLRIAVQKENEIGFWGKKDQNVPGQKAIPGAKRKFTRQKRKLLGPINRLDRFFEKLRVNFSNLTTTSNQDFGP